MTNTSAVANKVLRTVRLLRASAFLCGCFVLLSSGSYSCSASSVPSVTRTTTGTATATGTTTSITNSDVRGLKSRKWRQQREQEPQREPRQATGSPWNNGNTWNPNTSINTNENDDDKNDDWTDDKTDDDWREDNKDNNNKDWEQEVFPDDIYHCLDPRTVEEDFDWDKEIQCDWDTHEWDLSAFRDDRPPKYCKDWVFSGFQNLNEWDEPCYLWNNMYGSLAPSFSPSLQPSTPPTLAPTPVSTIGVSISVSIGATISATRRPTPKPTSARPSAPTISATATTTTSTTLNGTGTVKPTLAPATTSLPSMTPTMEQTTAEPTIFATSTEPTTSFQSEQPTSSSATLERPTGPRIYEIKTVVLTYMIDPIMEVPVNRRHLRQQQHHPQPQQQNNDNDNDNEQRIHYYAKTDYMSATPNAVTETRTLTTSYGSNTNNQNYAQQREAAWELDRSMLQDVTSKHVQREMKREMAFWLEQQGVEDPEEGPLSITVDLTMTSVRSFLLANDTRVTTEAISGFISVRGPPSLPAWPQDNEFEQHLDAIFEGPALRRYQERLVASNDPVLERTSYIEVGLPLDLLGGAGTNSQTNNIYSGSSLSNAAATTSGTNNAVSGTTNNGTVWTVFGVDFTLTTLAIIAASVAGFSILLLLCVCCKLRSIRKQNLAERGGDDSHNVLGTKSTDGSSLEEGGEAGANGNTKKSKRSLKTVRTKNGRILNKNKNTKNDPQDLSSPSASSEMIDESDPGNRRYYQRYIAEAEQDERSLATSTYSYLDSQLGGPNGGGNVSLAPSFLYGNDDASLQSKTMWSLIDGIANDDVNYNYHQTASPSPKFRPRVLDGDDEDDPNLQTPEAVLGLVKSPSNMMISTVTKANSNYYEDDNLSLTSLGVGTYSEYLQVSRSNTANIEEQQQQPASPLASAKPSSNTSTPTSQDDGPNNPFADEKAAARLGISARRKNKSAASGLSSNRNSNGSSSTAPSGVRKALGQLAACASSKPRDDYDNLVVPGAPSDESGNSQAENLTPTSLEKGKGESNSRTTISSRSRRSSSSKDGLDSTLKEVNERLQHMGDSTVNSKNSSLLPDKLFNDDTLESAGTTASNISVINSSQLLKDKNGDYIVDTMSSF